MNTLPYNVDPEELRALVDGIKELFRQAAEEQCVDIGDAVSLLTDVVRLVEPEYTPPEPDEVEGDVPDITATCSCCGGTIAVCDRTDEGYVWYHFSPSTCDDPDAVPGTIKVNGAPSDSTPSLEQTP